MARILYQHHQASTRALVETNLRTREIGYTDAAGFQELILKTTAGDFRRFPSLDRLDNADSAVASGAALVGFFPDNGLASVTVQEAIQEIWDGISGSVTGSGTIGTIPKFASSTVLGDSIIIQTGGEDIAIANASNFGNLTIGDNAQTVAPRIRLCASPTGNFAIFEVLGPYNNTNGVQFPIHIAPEVSQNATTSYTLSTWRVITKAATFTLPKAVAVNIESGFIGAGSTITDLYGIKIENQSGATNNYAIYTGTGKVLFQDIVTIGTTSIQPNTGLWLRSSNLTSGLQEGMNIDPEFSSAATSQGVSGKFRVRTVASAFTMAEAIGVQIMSPVIGSGSSITTLYGIKIEDQSGATTNYALYTGTGKVRFGDEVSIAQGTITDPAAAFTMTATWNDAADNFTLVDIDLTDTASNADSYYVNLKRSNFNIFAIKPFGQTGIGGDYASSNVMLRITSLAQSGGVGSPAIDAIAIETDITGASGTSNLYGVQVYIRTYGAVYTTTAAAAFLARSIIKGAGSTITTAYGLKVEDQTVGGINYAIYTGAGKVRFGDEVTIDATIVTKQQRGKYFALTDGATIAVDAAVSDYFYVTLGGNRTLSNPTNLPSAGLLHAARFLFRIRQDGTGSRTLSYDTMYRFPDGIAPTLSTGANKTDYLAFIYNEVDDKMDFVGSRFNF